MEKQRIASLEKPFPLQRIFRRRFLPALLVFIGVFLGLVGLVTDQVVKSIYLELAQRRAQTIARAVAESAPEAWALLLSGQSLLDQEDPRQVALLRAAFADEEKEMGLSELKVYDLRRRVLYATDPHEIGTEEQNLALNKVIDNGDAEVVAKFLADGGKQYELYVPLTGPGGAIEAVFELYEPVGYLNGILLRASAPIIAAAGLMLAALGLGLERLVGRAQRDIDRRTEAIVELRRRIESFVSTSAIDAAIQAEDGGGIRSQRVDVILLYSDIRDFSGYAEQHPPEQVVDFLNRLMTLQVSIIQRHGGDVDKMIGDAVLARFHGEAVRGAVAAAREILGRVEAGDFPRAIGIGLFRGDVISGAIGPADRRDFTVIGDAVNIAARLCSAAQAGELVCDAGLADDRFGPAEQITVKGRVQPIGVRRWQASSPAWNPASPPQQSAPAIGPSNRPQ